MNTLLVVLRNWILRENGQKPSISFDRTPTRFLAIASIVVPVVSIKGTILKDKRFVPTHVGLTPLDVLETALISDCRTHEVTQCLTSFLVH